MKTKVKVALKIIQQTLEVSTENLAASHAMSVAAASAAVAAPSHVITFLPFFCVLSVCL